MKKMKLKGKKKIRIRYKIIILFFIFFLSLYLMFRFLVNLNININDEDLVNYLLKDYTKEDIIKNKVSDKLLTFFKTEQLLGMKKVSLKEKNMKVLKEEKSPIVYLYNSHQTEEYAKTTLAEYSVNPTVFINDYIMQDILNKNGFLTLVEERSITEIRNLNGWNYAGCYKASRILMEDAKKNNNSLKYFIDIHRDSLPHDKTTIVINGEVFAKIIFLIGLENSNYQENLKFTEEINKKVEEKYPGLSKGIYKKGGPGVNGIYNQDFSDYTILIEIGGNENTITEVMNTTVAISEILSEVIKQHEIQEYS
ncbi:MAG: stage II sporulation protein P [Bacilli bacterium]|nr:stage II sporulation protein P [Bacilli bacterium]